VDALTVLPTLWFVHLLALASPGPNVLIVTQTALRETRRQGLIVALGLAVAGTVWATAAVIGLEAALTASPTAYTVLCLAGSAYLCFIGLKMIRPNKGARQQTGSSPTISDTGAFRLGLLTSFANPKALLFFAGLFTAILPPSLPSWIRIASIGIIFLDSLSWHAALAWFFSTNRAQRKYHAVGPWIDRVAGVLFVVLGVWLATSVIY
jgi:threonine efflux protein